MNNLEFAIKMQERTMKFAVQVVKFFVKLPRTDEARVPGKQLLRAGSSVGANYRAVCRSKSEADFISKMGTVVEEADECGFWLDLLANSGVCAASSIQPLKIEADELLRIFSTSLNTAKQNARSLPH
jgi:four helix bundle protein